MLLHWIFFFLYLHNHTFKLSPMKEFSTVWMFILSWISLEESTDRLDVYISSIPSPPHMESTWHGVVFNWGNAWIVIEWGAQCLGNWWHSIYPAYQFFLEAIETCSLLHLWKFSPGWFSRVIIMYSFIILASTVGTCSIWQSLKLTFHFYQTSPFTLVGPSSSSISIYFLKLVFLWLFESQKSLTIGFSSSLTKRWRKSHFSVCTSHPLKLPCWVWSNI